ncbi:hypothetical protein DPR02_10180 [Burkholderia cepacia]|uniref:Uncharacterized protein n=1 Tax=Burkholderia cepacia TaxID=292 RepID=A0AAQ0FE21_BURCE|nr:hypothetical protein DPR02_10180 [Burkholderia cepacia]
MVPAIFQTKSPVSFVIELQSRAMGDVVIDRPIFVSDVPAAPLTKRRMSIDSVRALVFPV